MQRIRLDQHGIELQRAQQNFQGLALVGFAVVKRGLRDRHTQLPRGERDLVDKSCCAIGAIGLRGRAQQSFVVTDQLIKILVLIHDLGDYPLLEQPEELLDLHPLKQVEEGGIAGCFGELQLQSGAEWMVMPFGKALQIPVAAAAAADAQDRHQQQQPLGVTHPSALACFGQRLNEGKWNSPGSGVGQRTGAVPTKPAPAWPHQQPYDGLSVGPGATSP